MDRDPRSFYAIEYAYGRDAVNNGNRADHIHRFATAAERTRFIDMIERDGRDADPLPATDARVKKALRYAALGLDWPQAV